MTQSKKGVPVWLTIGIEIKSKSDAAVGNFPDFSFLRWRGFVAISYHRQGT